MFRAVEEESNFVLESLELVVNTLLGSGLFGQPMENQMGHFSLNRDIKTVVKRFGFFVPTTEYIVCPECHSLHLPAEDSSFSPTCDQTQLEGGKCAGELGRKVHLKGGKTLIVPRKRFEYQSIKTWLGRLLARPGMEDIMDETTRGLSAKPTARDIWDGTYLPSFKWIDGSSFWRPGSGVDEEESERSTEGRFAIALGIDWYAALEDSNANKVVSVGAIFAVCLNLPFWLRHRPENACLAGIIPGPGKPHEDQVQNYLHPIVSDLVDFWTNGVWYSRTYRHLVGRAARLILALTCNDLDATRFLNGFATIGSTAFCSFCKLTLEEIRNLDYANWARRTPEEHRKMAEVWLKQTTAEKRKLVLNKGGYSYSEFLRLPYYNSIISTVLDIMHAIFKGKMGTHLSDFWQINPKVEGGDGLKITQRKPPTAQEMVRGRLLLRTATISQLSEVKQGVLEALCIETESGDATNARLTKDVLLINLQRWVSDIWLVFICLNLTLTFLRYEQQRRRNGIVIQGEADWEERVAAKKDEVMRQLESIISLASETSQSSLASESSAGSNTTKGKKPHGKPSKSILFSRYRPALITFGKEQSMSRKPKSLRMNPFSLVRVAANGRRVSINRRCSAAGCDAKWPIRRT